MTEEPAPVGGDPAADGHLGRSTISLVVAVYRADVIRNDAVELPATIG